MKSQKRTYPPGQLQRLVRPLWQSQSLAEMLPEEFGDELHRLDVLLCVGEEAAVAAAVEVHCLKRFVGLSQRALEFPRLLDRVILVAAFASGGAVRRTMQLQERRADARGEGNHLVGVAGRVEHGGLHVALLDYVLECGAAASRMPEEGDAVTAHSRKRARRSDERADDT